MSIRRIFLKIHSNYLQKVFIYRYCMSEVPKFFTVRTILEKFLILLTQLLMTFFSSSLLFIPIKTKYIRNMLT